MAAKRRSRVTVGKATNIRRSKPKTALQKAVNAARDKSGRVSDQDLRAIKARLGVGKKKVAKKRKR